MAGLLAPGGTPQPILEKLNEGVNAAVHSPGMKTFHDDTGKTPADFVTSVRLQAGCRLLEDIALAPKAVAHQGPRRKASIQAAWK